MLRKKKLLLIIIPGLVVINLLQWLPSTEHDTRDDVQLNFKQIKTHELRVAGFEASDKYIHNAGRDLFFINKSKVVNSALKNEVVEKSIKIITAGTGSTPINKNKISKKNDVSGLSEIRLEAVLFNNGKKSAYLVIGDNTYAIKKGDIVEKLYLIEDVSVSTVTLTDIKSHKSSIVPMQ